MREAGDDGAGRGVEAGPGIAVAAEAIMSGDRPVEAGAWEASDASSPSTPDREKAGDPVPWAIADAARWRTMGMTLMLVRMGLLTSCVRA
jgi:hypothetical protein